MGGKQLTGEVENILCDFIGKKKKSHSVLV